MGKLPILNLDGKAEPMSRVHHLTVDARIGPYEVRIFVEGDDAISYVVVCPPEMRKPDTWNYTRFLDDGNGNLRPADNDVELDPYHMCLLYQAVAQMEGSR